MFSTIPVILILVLVFVVIVISRIRIVQQAKAYVIERLGAYKISSFRLSSVWQKSYR